MTLCSANLQTKAYNGDTINQQCATWRRTCDRQSNVIIVCTITKHKIVAMKRESEFAVTNARGTFKMGQRLAFKRPAWEAASRFYILSSQQCSWHAEIYIVPFTRDWWPSGVMDRFCFRTFLLYRNIILQFAISLSQCLTVSKSFPVFEGEEFVRLLMRTVSMTRRSVNEKR